MAGETGTLAYVGAWVGLLILSTFTLLISTVTHGAAEVVLTLLSSTAKATVVAVVFMHLRHARFGVRITLVVAAAFIALLVSLTAVDMALRPPMPFAQPIDAPR
jgi:cytochrome c oxidase subunit 4